jgi:hypothetical protein
MKWQRLKTPARAQAVWIPIFSHLFSEEMTCCGSKNDFFKKSGGLLFSAKVQKDPGSSEIGRNLHKIQKRSPKAAATKRELICVSHVVYYLSGCFSQLSISHFGSCFTKKPDFGTSKMEKGLFMIQNKNRPPWHSSPSQKSRACPIWPCSDKLWHAHGRI